MNENSSELSPPDSMIYDNQTDAADLSFSSSIGSAELAEVAIAFDQQTDHSEDQSSSADLAPLEPDQSMHEAYKKRKQRQMQLEAEWISKKSVHSILELLIEEVIIRSSHWAMDVTVDEEVFLYEDDIWMNSIVEHGEKIDPNKHMFGGMGGEGDSICKCEGMSHGSDLDVIDSGDMGEN